MLHAPAFPKAQWLNTDQPLTLAQLRGQIVLLDFWTYCCINCIHVLPELKALEDHFQGQPVLVIGVHAAKFENEKDLTNIQSAIDRYEIEHPVLVDNDHQVWNAYAVRAWPTLVLIDAEGHIRAQVSGEGHLEELIRAIDELLEEGKQNNSLADRPLSLKITKNQTGTTLRFPGKIALDAAQTSLAISDSNHHRIILSQLRSPTQAQITQIVGNQGSGHQDGNFKQARFNQPQGLCFHKDCVYVADTKNHLIRVIDFKHETVSTLAGTGVQAEWGSQGGPGLSTALNSPWDVLVHKNYLWIAMAGSHQIWRMDLTTHEIQPWIGSGQENIVDGARTRAQLAQPSGLTANDEALFFADSETSSIRRYDWQTETVNTLVGHHLFIFGQEDGDLEAGLLQHPLGLAVDEASIFIADTYNHALREINLKDQKLSTLIKKMDQNSCQLGDTQCQILPLQEPNDVKVAGRYLYLADTNNHLIRVWDRQEQTLNDLQLMAG